MKSNKAKPQVGDLVWVPSDFAVFWQTSDIEPTAFPAMILSYVTEHIVEILASPTNSEGSSTTSVIRMHIHDLYKTQEEALVATVGVDDLLDVHHSRINKGPITKILKRIP
jgi:hypothetical protein